MVLQCLHAVVSLPIMELTASILAHCVYHPILVHQKHIVPIQMELITTFAAASYVVSEKLFLPALLEILFPINMDILISLFLLHVLMAILP